MSAPATVTDLIEKSEALERAGKIGDALCWARNALREARASGTGETVGAALVCVAHIWFRTGSYQEARRLAEEALSHTGSDSRTRAGVLLILGLCSAETFYHQAIDLSRRLSYWRALLRFLHNLSAGVYVPRGQFDLALAADRDLEDLA